MQALYGRLTYVVSDPLTGLEFMAAGWREDEDGHTTLLALLYFLYVQI